PYQPVGPIEARSLAAVLLRTGPHILGVLSVDWMEPGACRAAMASGLEELVERYALFLRGLSPGSVLDPLVEQLGQVLPQGNSRVAVDRLLEGLARTLGCRRVEWTCPSEIGSSHVWDSGQAPAENLSAFHRSELTANVTDGVEAFGTLRLF